MSADTGVRRVLPLPAAPRSAGEARRFVRSLLVELGRESCSEAASLAVSELVTNAVLHAHTEVELAVVAGRDAIRIEVRDDNPVLPAARSYDDHATTGRGLELVASVSDSHGVESLGDAGKVVWCSICGGDDEAGADAPAGDWDDALELTAVAPQVQAPDAVNVVLQRMPATLWLAAREHHDAVLREMALLRLSAADRGDAGPVLADGELVAVDAARALLEAAVDADLEHAREQGRTALPLPQYHPGALPAVPASMDLRLQVRRADADAFAALQDLLDEAERLAGADRLLVRPGLPEVVAVRDWACEQVIAQVAGSPGKPWPGADDDRFADDVDAGARPVGWDDTPVREATVGAIAVDEANRVVAVSRPLAELLGWAIGDLVGRRVVAIVPPRYREAHVAGFSRHLSTGDARALGVELLLPVLRADGTELDCRFLIESTATPGGRVVYLAWITPLEAGQAPSGG